MPNGADTATEQAEAPRGRWRRRLAVLVVAAILLLLAALPAAHRPLLRLFGDRATPPEELTIFLTADTRGHLEPCGCRANQSGGLPVRSTLLNEHPSANRLLIDAGNTTYGSREYDLLKLDYIRKGMAAMQYDVVNLAANDVMLTKDQLLDLTRKHESLDFVSCNVVDAQSRQPVVNAHVVRSYNGYRVGITGVTRHDLEIIGDGLAVLPPLEALGREIPRLAKRCDYLIVAAFVDRETMDEITGRFYEADVVLGGDVPQSSAHPEKANDAIVFAVTDRGKILGQVSLRRSEAGGLEMAGGGGTEVRDTLPTDPKITAVVDAFKQELKDRRIEFAESHEHLDPVAPPPRSASADRYATSEECASCHRASYDVWQQSAHAHSLATLKPRNNQYDPECLPCHTLGYGAGDGYVSEEETPMLGGVQCESCHGRGTKHAEAQRRGEPPAVSTFRAVTPNTCIKCHDEENSENFSYDRYWPMIDHGESPMHARSEPVGDGAATEA